MRRWDYEVEVPELKKLWAEGMKVEAIGEQLGRTKNQVYHKAKNLGLIRNQRQFKAGVRSRRRVIMHVSEEMWQHLLAQSKYRRMSVSRYVRYLCHRDTGFKIT